MTKYVIKPLPILKIELDMGSFTYRMYYGKKIWAPIYSWYVTDGGRNILIDSAVDAEFVRKSKGIPTKEIMSFEDSLGSLGLRSNDIDLVIQTHLHYDHCGNTFKCRNAKVVVQKEELKFALSPHPAMMNVYHKPFLQGLRFEVVRGRCEIFPGIELIPAPGHSPGTQAVSVVTAKGKAVITGFCSMKENFEPPEEVQEAFPVIPPGIHTNVMDAFDSVLSIRGIADILIPQHDPSFLNISSIP